MLSYKDKKMNDESQLSNSPGGDKPQHTSERKAQANRENSKKSTGPRTERGKRNSSFNAMTHGLLATRIPDDDIEGLGRFATALYEEYGGEGGLRNELLREFVVTDYWRLKRGLEAEKQPVGTMDSAVPGFTEQVRRYNTTNRRSLMRNLDELEESARRAGELQAAEPAPKGIPDGESVGKGGVPPKKPASGYPPEEDAQGNITI